MGGNNDKVKQVEKPRKSFKSTFAKEIEAELEANAARRDVRGEKEKVVNEIGGGDRHDRREYERHESDWNEQVEGEDRERYKERWEILEPKEFKRKVRKPLEVKSWFRNETDTSCSSSDEEWWKDVSRKKLSEEKNKRKMLNRQKKKEEVARKGSMMRGIGPIINRTKIHLEKITEDKNKARTLAVRQLLTHSLDFNEEELDRLDIRETKEGKDDMVYFAAANEEMLREIHWRKAESRNDKLTLINYVPPAL